MDATRADVFPCPLEPSYPRPGRDGAAPSIFEALLSGRGRAEAGQASTEPDRGSRQRALSWDEDNRVVSVRENGQDLSRALYDGAGERRVHLRRVAGDASSRGSAFLNIANGAP